jgi:hypothetical protein
VSLVQLVDRLCLVQSLQVVVALGSLMVAGCITTSHSTVDLLIVLVVHGCSTEVAAVLVLEVTVRTHQGTKLVALVELDSLYGGVSTQAVAVVAVVDRVRQQPVVAAVVPVEAF